MEPLGECYCAIMYDNECGSCLAVRLKEAFREGIEAAALALALRASHLNEFGEAESSVMADDICAYALKAAGQALLASLEEK